MLNRIPEFQSVIHSPSVERVLGRDGEFSFLVLGAVRHEPGADRSDWGNGGLFALNLVIEGKVTLWDGLGRSYALAPGSLYQNEPGLASRLESDPEGPMVELFAVLHPRLARALKDLFLVPRERVVQTTLKRETLLEFLKLRRLCQKTAMEVNRREVIQALVRWVRGCYAEYSPLPQSGYWPRVAHQAALALTDRPAERHDPESVARTLGVSYSSLRRAFRKVYGMSPVQYQMKHRLDLACELLLQHPVKEVAAMLGYPDPFGFSAQFKKQLGLSPLQYRTGHARDK